MKYSQATLEADMATVLHKKKKKKEGLPATLLPFHMPKRCTDSAYALEITAVGGPFGWRTHKMENWVAGREPATVYTATLALREDKTRP